MATHPGRVEDPVQGQGSLADARPGCEDNEVARLEALGQVIEAAEAHPDARGEAALHAVRQAYHGIVGNGLDGQQALGLGIALRQLEEALGREVHEHFRRLVLLGGLPDQLGA